MAIIYMGRAVNDLRAARDHALQGGHPDPVAYIATLRSKIEHQYSINNPGVAGRRTGTKEWILAPLPYVVVFKKVKSDIKIYRVLPGRAIKVPRPSPSVARGKIPA